MGWVHLDAEGAAGDLLRDRQWLSGDGDTPITLGGDPVPWGGGYLVGEQHHDGVEPRARRRVLHRERVVVVLDDVKVNVGLHRPHHTRGALDPDAHITCRVGTEAIRDGSPQGGGDRGGERGCDVGLGLRMEQGQLDDRPRPGMLDQDHKWWTMDDE